MAKVVILSGSATAKSRLDGVLAWLEASLRRDNIETETIKVRDLPPEALIYAQFDHPAVVDANRLLAEADAVIVASPIYKASYTGVLKTFLDLIPQKGLEGKIVLPVAIGGTNAHLLAIDHAFKPVLSALSAFPVLQGVFVLDVQVERQEDGGYTLSEEITGRLAQAAEVLVQEIHLRNSVRRTEQAEASTVLF